MKYIFIAQMSSRQLVEQTMFFTLTKMIQSIRMADLYVWKMICLIKSCSGAKQVSCVPIPLFKHLLVRQQLLRKYYMRALAIKYSISTGIPWHWFFWYMYLSNKMFIDFPNFWCCEVHVDGS